MNDKDSKLRVDGAVRYESPEVSDYGTVDELTAAGGTQFVDTPAGTPAPGITNGSTP